MSVYDKDNRASIITQDGRLAIAKQNGGISMPIIGCALIKDNKEWIKRLCKSGDTYDFSKLSTITFDDLKEHCTIIFKNVTYSYDNDMHTPIADEYEAALKNPEKYLYPVKESTVDATDKEPAKAVYKIEIVNGMIDENATGDQTFDAVAYFIQPYTQLDKNISASITKITDKQTIALFGLEYFADAKPTICSVEHVMLGINVEYTISGAYDVTNGVSSDYLSAMPAAHFANDALTNTRLLNSGEIATTNNMLLTSVPSETTQHYDSFAKLNIMTVATSAISDSVPQLMLSVANADEDKSWDGRRLVFNYTSGGPAGGSLFRMYEITGKDKQRINFELMGTDNLYRGVSGAYGNAFVYAEENEISPKSFQNSFIDSDRNAFEIDGVHHVSFVNTKDCIIGNGETGTSVYDVSLYDTRNAHIIPNSYNGQKGIISNQTVINSDFITIAGNTNSTNDPIQGVFISSPSAKHKFKADGNVKQDISIGNSLGFMSMNECDMITIGRGLEGIGCKGEGKVIVGNFNENVSDPDDIFVVGDGFIKDEYLASIANEFETVDKNDNFYSRFMDRGDVSGNYYRHNLFTVNKNGWVMISNREQPELRAKIGTSGISAYDSTGLVYDISYRDISMNVQPDATIQFYQNTLDYYAYEYANAVSSVPTFFTSTSGDMFFDGLGHDLFTSAFCIDNSITTLFNRRSETVTISGNTYNGSNVISTWAEVLQPGNAMQIVYAGRPYVSSGDRGFYKIQ